MIDPPPYNPDRDLIGYIEAGQGGPGGGVMDERSPRERCDQAMQAGTVAEKAPTLDQRAEALRCAREALEAVDQEGRVLRRLSQRTDVRWAVAREEVDRAERWFAEAVAQATGS